MFEGFTDEVRRVVAVAQKEARDLHHPFVGTEHLLLGLLSEHDAIAEQVLEQLGVPLEAVRREVADRVGNWGVVPEGSPPFTPRAKKVLKTARVVGQGRTGTEHIWVGIDLERDGIAAEVLADLGMSLGSLRATILSEFRLAGGQGPVGHVSQAISFRGFPHQDRITRFQRFWYRYPGRWIFPLVAWLDCSVPGTKGRVGWISRPRRRPRPADPSTMTVRRRAVSDRLHPGALVGTEMTIAVVHVGRGPGDFARAYDALAQLAANSGIELDDARVSVESVQTEKGPGLRLVVSHRLDEHDAGEGGEESTE